MASKAIETGTATSLHEALLMVRELVESGEHEPDVGICDLLDRIGVRGHWGDLWRLFRAWPKFSGNISCPVSVDYKTPGLANPVLEYLGGHLWTGPYGDLRRELLDWLIEQTRPSQP